MVAVEKVPASTRIRISNFLCTESSRICQQDLADHFRAACDAEVSEDDIQIFPDEHYVTVKFHSRPGKIIIVINKSNSSSNNNNNNKFILTCQLKVKVAAA